MKGRLGLRLNSIRSGRRKLGLSTGQEKSLAPARPYLSSALILISSLLSAGCAGPEKIANQTAKATPAVAPTIVITPDQSAVKTFPGRGRVTKINLELVSVELDHEEIEGLMPKMIMEFYVAEKRELEALRVGDEVAFVLEDNRGAERITSIKKIK